MHDVGVSNISSYFIIFSDAVLMVFWDLVVNIRHLFVLEVEQAGVWYLWDNYIYLSLFLHLESDLSISVTKTSKWAVL